MKAVDDIWNIQGADHVLDQGDGLLAYLYTVKETIIVDGGTSNAAGGGARHAGFRLYFVDQGGRTLCLTQKAQPYLLVSVTDTFANVKCGDLDSVM